MTSLVALPPGAVGAGQPLRPSHGRRPRGREGFVARAGRRREMARPQARQIASYRGPQQEPVSDLEAGRGRTPEPVQRRRRCRRMRPTSDRADPAKRIAPTSFLSVRIASEARRDRPRGRPSDDERAGRGERRGAWRDNPIGVVGGAPLPKSRRPPQAGEVQSSGPRQTLAFGEGRCDAPCSRRQSRASGSVTCSHWEDNRHEKSCSRRQPRATGSGLIKNSAPSWLSKMARRLIWLVPS